jgi:RNA polymerase sigma factor (sigma-70 family)
LDTEKNTEQIDVITSWVREHSDKLYARAMFQTNNVEVSEDLVQETFLAATKSFETFDRRSKPSTWLFAILNNKIADYHRRNGQR